MEILLIDSISVQCFDNHLQKSLHSLDTLLPNLETPNYSSCSTNISKLTSTRRVGMCKIVYLNIKACGIYVYMYQSYTRPWLDRSI